ncbi:MAG: class I SAM-dependent methyltransferase, partial [bacterium]
RILPNRFELFIEPVTLKEEYRIPFTWENTDLFGFDFGFVKEQMRDRLRDDYYFRSLDNYEVERYLCATEPVLELDLETVEPKGLARHIHYRRAALVDGQLDGFALYFRAIFDDRISFSNAPTGRNTSWLTRLLRVEARRLATGDTVAFEMHMPDIANPNTWRWSGG